MDVGGGYAEYACVLAGYAHRLPGGYPDAELAPLLCAGIIGYRALKRAALPRSSSLNQERHCSTRDRLPSSEKPQT